MTTKQSQTHLTMGTSSVSWEQRNSKSDLKVEIWVHGQKFEDHLSCEDPCEDLTGQRSEVRGQRSKKIVLFSSLLLLKLFVAQVILSVDTFGLELSDS